MTADTEHRWDKLALFTLAGLVVIVLGSIVWGVFWSKVVPDKGDVLLGGIATGLILFLQRLVDAVRSSWDAVTQAKTMERLGNSSPVNDNTVPADAVEAANQTADAAVEQAGEIEARAKP